MTVYAITNAERFARPIVIAYPDHATALAAIEEMPADVSARIVEDEFNLDREYPSKQLLDLANALSERPIERFSDRAYGLRRTFSLIARLANGGLPDEPREERMTQEENAVTEPLESSMTTPELEDEFVPTTSPLDLHPATEEPAPKTKSSTGKRGRAPAYPRERIIRLLKIENPKRIGSATYARYRLYRDGMTVGAFLDAGGTSADLLWDVDELRKFIAIE